MNNQKRMAIIEAIGWYGPVALILAYALVSFGVVGAESYAFQLLNLTGAIAIIVISAAKKVYQSVALNIFWSIIAIVALVRLLIA
ncbi:hypothetical protein IRY61_03690 [Candidatus Saccharibacteria bacterium]|jgi:hypothetical protein|nr:hypothetical protein [Candidatus Saccharibacteria bacterium]